MNYVLNKCTVPFHRYLAFFYWSKTLLKLVLNSYLHPSVAICKVCCLTVNLYIYFTKLNARWPTE